MDESNDGTTPPPELPSKEFGHSDKENVLRLSIHLGADVWLKVVDWPTRVLNDIRRWREVDGQLVWTSRGVSLPLKRYLLLRDEIPAVSEAMAEVDRKVKDDINLSLHIGYNYYVSVKSLFRGASLREFFLPNDALNDELKPGRGLFF